MLVEREIHGSKMLLDDEEGGLSAQLLAHGTREGQTPFILEKLIQPGWTCLDIGANLGFFALMEAKAGATVYAIEPLPRNVDILKANFELNGYQHIEVFQLAIGNKIRDSKFMVTRQGNWCTMKSMVAKSAEPPFAIDEITVPETTLDQFVADNQIQVIDFLRFDVEGYEVELVQCGQKTLSEMPVGSWIGAELHMKSFDDPVISLEPTVLNLLEHGFELKHASREIPNLREICRHFPNEAPQVFLQKV